MKQIPVLLYFVLLGKWQLTYLQNLKKNIEKSNCTRQTHAQLTVELSAYRTGWMWKISVTTKLNSTSPDLQQHEASYQSHSITKCVNTLEVSSYSSVLCCLATTNNATNTKLLAAMMQPITQWPRPRLGRSFEVKTRDR